MLDDELDLFNALLIATVNIKLLVLGPCLLSSVLRYQGYINTSVQRDVVAELARNRLTFRRRRPGA